jgi:hypothetical protein
VERMLGLTNAMFASVDRFLYEVCDGKTLKRRPRVLKPFVGSLSKTGAGIG